MGCGGIAAAGVAPEGVDCGGLSVRRATFVRLIGAIGGGIVRRAGPGEAAGASVGRLAAVPASAGSGALAAGEGA
jgi:hypothetical protein